MVESRVSRRASAELSIPASADSTDRRTRPQRSSSQEASKPYCHRLNGAIGRPPVTVLGIAPDVPPRPLAEVLPEALPLLAPPPKMLIAPRLLIFSRV